MTGSLGLAQLAQLFEQLDSEVSDPAPARQAIDALVAVAVDQVPGAEHAGITVGTTGGQFTTLAATSDVTRQVDALQYELGSGPCVDAIVDEPLQRSADLAEDPRWPVFGPRAARETGIVSMLSHRLYLEVSPDTVAALNFYSTRHNAFTPDDEVMSLVLAAHGATTVARAIAQDKADNLAIALTNSREIGIAMGIVMQQYKLSRAQAFDLLRTFSQHGHRKVADIASEIADTGIVPTITTARRDTLTHRRSAGHAPDAPMPDARTL